MSQIRTEGLHNFFSFYSDHYVRLGLSLANASYKLQENEQCARAELALCLLPSAKNSLLCPPRAITDGYFPAVWTRGYMIS